MIQLRVWVIPMVLAMMVSGCDRPRPEDARAALEGAAANELGPVADHVRSARAALKIGDGVAAEGAVKAALAAGGDEAALRPLLAHSYAMQGDGNRALQTLDGGPIAPDRVGEAAWIAGNIHLSNGDLDAARNAFDRAVRELPRESALWVDVARFREASADTPGARDAVEHAIELDGRNSAALAYRANLVRTQQGLAASLSWYDAALAVDPDNAAALIDRAATLGDMGRYRDMLVSLRHAATIAPSDPRLFYLQAVLAARAGNFPLARSMLQRTDGRMDNLPGFMLLNAIVELELGGEALAATWADRLLADQPNNRTARRIMAAAEWAGGDPDGAAETLARMAERADADSWTLLLAARVAAELGRTGAAAAFQARAASLTRGVAAPFAVDNDFGRLSTAADAEPLNAAAVVPAISGELAGGAIGRAMGRAARLRDANRGVADAQILFGDAAMAGGRADLAVPAYRAAYDMEAGERAALRLADAMRRTGDAAGAGVVVQSLRERDPSSIAADRLAGARAMEGGDWDRAIAHFDRVRHRIGNRDAVILRDLARAWAAKGDDARALPLIARAYRLQPLNRGIMTIYAALLARDGDAQAAADLRDKAAQIGR